MIYVRRVLSEAGNVEEFRIYTSENFMYFFWELTNLFILLNIQKTYS